MSDVATKPRTEVRPKTERPRLHKVILLNDDYTPREFVVAVLKGEFRMSEEQAYRVMITAHRRGLCVVAVFAKDVAETKAAHHAKKEPGVSIGPRYAAGLLLVQVLGERPSHFLERRRGGQRARKENRKISHVDQILVPEV